MELKQAKEVISQAIDAALKSGVYNLSDVKVIIQALSKIDSVDDIKFEKVEKI